MRVIVGVKRYTAATDYRVSMQVVHKRITVIVMSSPISHYKVIKLDDAAGVIIDRAPNYQLAQRCHVIINRSVNYWTMHVPL
jgi:hypothetical protein